MKRHFFILATVANLYSTELLATAQIPDILWFNGTKYSLYSNPLESYFNKDNPRPQQIIENGCWSTACWRGYQAKWKIIDNQLYLTEIGSCCNWEKYLITDKVIEILSNKDVPEDILTKLEKLKKGNHR